MIFLMPSIEEAEEFYQIALEIKDFIIKEIKSGI